MKKVEKSIEFGGRKLTISTGDLAQQATSTVLASYGETVVLATVVAAPLKEDIGYFPLFVEYQERLYAGGRIKGSRWVKREGRPTDDEILTGRLIDRSIRPLFPSDYKKQVQVVVTVLSVDMENTPDMIASVAVSAALTASEIPWQGPLATLRVGRKDGKFISNPTVEEMKTSDIDLIVSFTDKAIVMIEAGTNQIPEEEMIKAVEHAQKEAKTLMSFISDFASEVGKKKEVITKEKVNITLEKKVKEAVEGGLKDIIVKMATKEIGYAELDEYKSAIKDNFTEDEAKEVSSIFDKLFKDETRKMTLLGKRPDGRKSDELRKLDAKVGVLPRTHGSAIFLRGQTQALTVSTLGPPSSEQYFETAEGEETKRYIHYYNFPPYSVGEVGFMRGPGRREIGHGALAERALLPVIPDASEFPYTIMVVTEILSSNGSTSMASATGSTLSLMDAGVPIKAPVAGIAMGLVVESEKKYVVLTDITGLEDGSGDMDFKVAGTKDGITALQLDVKTLSLTLSILKDALTQAKKAREDILKVVVKAIAEPRTSVSTYAPKIKVVKVPQEKIGEVIGPGGKMIKSIIAETGAQVDIEDDGTVNISGSTDEEVARAVEKVELLTKEILAGEIYDGTVKRIESFGAFVEVVPGRDGMVHVSDMSEDFVKNPTDVVSIGDKVQVRVKEIDNLGRINLSMIMDASKDKEKKRQDRPRNDRGGRRYDNKDKQKRGSGPHFPTSRLMESKDNYRK
jgi:polyribonucleotide nucleotidyltransferase